MPKIQVTFDIDVNGILQVMAKDMATGKDQRITITASSGLSKDTVENLVQEAKAHEEEDKKKKEGIETFNQADTLIYATQKAVGEYGDKLNDAEKKEIEDAISELKDAMEKKDVDAVKNGIEKLGKASQKIGEEMYKQAAEQQAQAQQQATPGDTKEGDVKEGEVIDGEYKVGE